MALKKRPVRFPTSDSVTPVNLERLMLHYDEQITDLQNQGNVMAERIAALESRVSTLEAAP